MSGRSEACSKCGGTMEQGFVLDMAHGGGRLVSHWVAGPPVKSFWLGTKRSQDMVPIGTFRCSKCGFLESYAGAEFAAE